MAAEVPAEVLHDLHRSPQLHDVEVDNAICGLSEHPLVFSIVRSFLWNRGRANPNQLRLILYRFQLQLRPLRHLPAVRRRSLRFLRFRLLRVVRRFRLRGKLSGARSPGVPAHGWGRTGDNGTPVNAIVAADGKSLSFDVPKDKFETRRYLVFLGIGPKELAVSGDLVVAPGDTTKVRVDSISGDRLPEC